MIPTEMESHLILTVTVSSLDRLSWISLKNFLNIDILIGKLKPDSKSCTEEEKEKQMQGWEKRQSFILNSLKICPAPLKAVLSHCSQPVLSSFCSVSTKPNAQDFQVTSLLTCRGSTNCLPPLKDCIPARWQTRVSTPPTDRAALLFRLVL